jgi:hypothetical protein
MSTVAFFYKADPKWASALVKNIPFASNNTA